MTEQLKSKRKNRMRLVYCWRTYCVKIKTPRVYLINNTWNHARASWWKYFEDTLHKNLGENNLKSIRCFLHLPLRRNKNIMASAMLKKTYILEKNTWQSDLIRKKFVKNHNAFSSISKIWKTGASKTVDRQAPHKKAYDHGICDVSDDSYNKICRKKQKNSPICTKKAPKTRSFAFSKKPDRLIGFSSKATTEKQRYRQGKNILSLFPKWKPREDRGSHGRRM